MRTMVSLVDKSTFFLNLKLQSLSYREVATGALVHGVRSTQVWVASVRSSVMLRLRKAVYLVLLAADGPSIFAVTARGWLKIPTSQNERV